LEAASSAGHVHTSPVPSHWTRRRACSAISPGLRRGRLGRRPDEVAADVVLFQEDPNPDPALAGIEDGLSDGPGVDLLDGDVKRALRARDEVDDDLFQVVCATEFGRTDVGLDPAVGEAGPADGLRP
jgi:hypothetical protein